mgnify:CR=1 FL=1
MQKTTITLLFGADELYHLIVVAPNGAKERHQYTNRVNLFSGISEVLLSMYDTYGISTTVIEWQDD